MSSTQNYYRLEQLAQLGLPSQIFIPAFLQELHHVIPSLSNTFCWQDNNGDLNNIYDEVSNAEIFKVFLTAISSDEPDKYTATNEWVSNLDKPTTTSQYYGQCSLVAKFYKTILLPLGYINTCFVPVFDTKTKQRLGVLMVHRTKEQNAFSKKDLLNLQYISSIISDGLTLLSRPHLHMIDGWDQGILIIDKKGDVQRSCPMGEKLLSMASSPIFDRASSSNFSPHNLHVFSGYNKLIHDLLHDNAKRPIKFKRLLTTQNPWGEFKLYGFMIEDKVGNRTAQIGLNIRRQQPFSLKLFQQIKNLGLTPRQETVCLLYAIGDPYLTISKKLDLSIHTVKEHVKNISKDLKTRSRADLIERIICG